MKAGRRKDVVMARVIFAIICILIVAIIVGAVLFFVFRGKDDKDMDIIPTETQTEEVMHTEPLVNEEPTEVVEEVYKQVRTTSSVNLREQPDKTAPVIVVLPRRTELGVLSEVEGWVKVDYEGKIGYVSSDYVKDYTPGDSSENGYVIVIDPGHQAQGDSSTEPVGPGSSETKAKVASGTQGRTTGVPEYKLTLEIGLALRDELEARGYTVYMTRETNDVNISNSERALYASTVDADIAIRLHADGIENSSVSGASILCPSSSNRYVGDLSAESAKLSQAVIDSYCAATGLKNNGISYRDDLTGFNWSEVTMTLLEMGYMTNASDDTNMQDAAFQDKMVQGIADGIDAYFGR